MTVSKFFDRPQPAAAKALGISLTSMKLVRTKQFKTQKRLEK